MTSPAVCFGSPSPEHDISILTGLQAGRALADRGHDVIGIYWDATGGWWRVDASAEARSFVDGPPKGAQQLRLAPGADGGFVAEGRLGRGRPLDLSAVVNCCHGAPGEDGTLQAALDLAGVTYTGPTAAAAALGMDKLAFGEVARGAGLAVLPRRALTASLGPMDEPGPYIVKPRFGGSSIGIEVVDDLATARALLTASPHLRSGAVVEPYLPDAIDLNLAVLTHPDVRLSSVEKPLRAADGRIYSYAEKYLQGADGMSSAPRELPAQIDTAVVEAMRSAARALVDVAMVGSGARLDFLLAGDRLLVNEVNPIPGALGWYFWSEQGIPFGQFLESLVDEAVARGVRELRTDGADGTALRSAGSIAAKLG